MIIIDSIDYLNNNSLNALLKILEEPPQNTVFFLISHLIKPVLATIKSRAIKLNFWQWHRPTYQRGEQSEKKAVETPIYMTSRAHAPSRPRSYGFRACGRSPG